MRGRGLLILAVVLGVLCVLEGAALLFMKSRASWQRSAADSQIERGRRIAEAMGCFGCHGPGGASPIPNPGGAYGEVPAWDAGNWMLWNNDEADVRAWITDGRTPGRSPDPEALVQMPAYGKLLSDSEVDDLVTYVLAVSQFGRPADARVAAGRGLASRLGCFGCHGPEGRGLVMNPGSYRGYIPSWDSDDFEELVRSDDEFRQWVRNGVADRLRSNPASRAFLASQPIPMPAYGELIDDNELDAILAYVRWMRENPRGPRPKRR